jgi:O-antigen ligase
MNGQSLTQRVRGSPGLTYILAVGTALVLGRAIFQENWRYLAALGLLAAIPLAIRWPVAMSLGLYAFLVPFDSVSTLGQGTAGVTLLRLVGAGVCAFLLAVGLLGRRLVRPPKAAFWWIGFIAWGAITMFWAIDSDSALERLPTAVSLLLLYLIVVSIRLNEREFSSVIWLALLGAVAAAAFTIYQYLQGVTYHSVLGIPAERASLIVGERESDPNQFASSLLLPLSCAIGLFLASRGKLKKLFVVALTLIITAGLYLTMSRGTLLALLPIGIVYLYRFRVRWRVWAILTLLAALMLAMPEVFFVRLQEAFETGGAGRLTFWQVGLKALKHYGWLGTGWDGFPVAYNEYARYAPVFEGFGRGAHNIYLGMWVELGIIGLLLMLGAVIAHLHEAQPALTARSGRRDILLIATEAACWGMLACGFFLDIVWRKPFWLVWMLLPVAVRIHKSRAAGSGP